MQTQRRINRKDFLKGSVAGVLALVVGRLFTKKAQAVESLTDVAYYDEPAVGQPGYEKRVAKLFKSGDLPEKATRI